jgi:hypothetical protein
LVAQKLPQMWLKIQQHYNIQDPPATASECSDPVRHGGRPWPPRMYEVATS